MSTLYGIGVGVGESEMLTLKAVKTLEKIDVIVLPEAKLGEGSVAYSIVKDYLKDSTEKLFVEFSMNKDIEVRKKSRKENVDKIREYLDKKMNVGFVTIGDPMIYSTYAYLIKELKEDYNIETVSGIPTFIDISSRVNLPLVYGDESLKIISFNDKVDIEKEIENSDNIVFMKVSRNFEKLRDAIYKTNNENNVVLVSNSGKDTQEIYYDLNKIDINALSYFTTLILKKGGI
ncbi:MAG: precorrin-2 C(20)-methyltransferase [Fusobacteriaceae bacterium]